MKTTRALFQAIFLICIILVLLFFQKEMRDFLNGARVFIFDMLGSKYSESQFLKIKAENKALTRENEILLLKLGEKGRERSNFVAASVYSTYPFNNKATVIIDKGSDDGMSPGMPVFYKKNIIIGRITGVRRTQSEVKTVFDAEWKTSVAVGTSSVKAVLTGGNNPAVEFIPKDAIVKEGDEIKNIASVFPMDSVVGSVKSIQLDEKKLWQIAHIELPFSVESLDSVEVMTNFP